VNARAADLIASLGMTAHPEGGYFRELYRSDLRVLPSDRRGGRAALTTIYFLLTAGDISRWHRVASDEVWHYYEGDPLELFTADAEFDQVSRHVLHRPGAGAAPVSVVPAHRWQAARTTGGYTLVGCTVGPGFEFQDFEMLSDRPDLKEMLRQRRPDAAGFV
jgi:predicted cupin superfamily sugar epimerase